MDLIEQNDTDNNYLSLLEALILKKLSQEELMIGTAYLEGEDYAIVSLDEYNRLDVNLNLYCSNAGQFFLEIEDFDNNEDPKSFALRDNSLAAIPEGLRTLMLATAQTGQSATFRKDQLHP